MDWSQDFCLSCDNVNPTDGPYCSEACRLLDMDKSADMECSHASVYASSYASRTSNWVASSSNRSSGFYLAPAVDFSALRTASLPAATAVSLPGSPQSATHCSYFVQTSTPTNPSTSTRPHHSHSSSRKSLASSSSRSSLSSINASGSSSSHGLSDQTMSQLRNYLNSFDHTRDLRRQVTLA